MNVSGATLPASTLSTTRTPGGNEPQVGSTTIDYPALGLPRALPEWEPVDLGAAVEHARTAVEHIDFSKRDIVLYVPGLKDVGVRPQLADAVERAGWSDASLSAIDYGQSTNLWSAVPLGVATVGHVLDAVAARKRPDQRVLVYALSGGAWATGIALADAARAAVVDKALLVGHPSYSPVHFPSAEVEPDARIVEVNHPDDYVANAKLRGSERLRRGTLAAMYGAVKAPLLDVVTGVAMNLDTVLPPLVNKLARTYLGTTRNPHGYDAPDEQDALVRVLRD